MKQPKVIFYKGADKKWRWKMVASNGRKLCSPGESFSSYRKAVGNWYLVSCVISGDEFDVVAQE